MNDLEIKLTQEAEDEINMLALRTEAVTDVQSDADARAASALVKQGRTLVKIVHDQRMAVSRKVDAVKKQLIAKEHELVADLSSQIERVAKLCADYVARKEAAKAAEAAEAAKAEAMLTGNVPSMPESSSPAVAGVKARVAWDFAIVEPELVPRAYCSPDERLIREYANAVKRSGGSIDELHIPGVVFVEVAKI